MDGLHRFAGVAPVAVRPLRVVWLGDSLAAGLGADDPADTPALATAEALRMDCHISVLAVPGAKMADVLDTQIPALVSLDAPETRPDLVVIAVGANDVSAVTPRADFVADLHHVLTACHPTPVLLLSLPDIGCATRLGQPLRTVAAARARWLDRAQRSTAARFDNVVRVDIASLPPGVTRAQARTMLCADRFHPSGAGYRVWADRIAAAAAGIVGLPGPCPLSSEAPVS